MGQAIDECTFRCVVLPRAIAGVMIVVAVGLLLVAGFGSLLVNSTAVTSVSLLVLQTPMVPTG
jgi:hypothetical protein